MLGQDVWFACLSLLCKPDFQLGAKALRFGLSRVYVSVSRECSAQRMP